MYSQYLQPFIYLMMFLGLFHMMCRELSGKWVMNQRQYFKRYIEYYIIILLAVEALGILRFINYYLLLTLIFIAIVLINRLLFSTYHYIIRVKDKTLFQDTVTSTLDKLQLTQPQIQHEASKITYTYGPSRQKVVLESTEKIFTNGDNYNLIFRRWKDKELRELIINNIEEQLGQQGAYKPSLLKRAVNTLLASFSVAAILFIIVTTVMQPRYLYIHYNHPTIYLHAKDEIIEDEQKIERFVDLLNERKPLFRMNVSSSEDESWPGDRKVVEYGEFTIYLEERRNLIYMSYDRLRNKSLFHELTYQVYRQFKEADGACYYLWLDDEAYNEMMKLIE